MDASQDSFVEETVEQKLERLDQENRDLSRIRDVVVPQLESRIRRYEDNPDRGIITDLENKLKDSEALVQELQENALRNNERLQELESQLHGLRSGEQQDTGQQNRVIAQLEDKLRDSEELVRLLQEHVEAASAQKRQCVENNVEETEPKLIYNQFTQEDARQYMEEASRYLELYTNLKGEYEELQKTFENREMEFCEMMSAQQMLENADNKIANMVAAKETILVLRCWTPTAQVELVRRVQHGESEIATKDEVLRAQQEDHVKLVAEYEDLKRRFHALKSEVREERHKQEIESDIATKDEVLRVQQEEYQKLITEHEELKRHFYELENKVREERHKQEIESEIATKDEVLRVQQEEYQKLITEHDELKRRFHELENKVREERHKQEIESEIATKDEVLRVQQEEYQKLITEHDELKRRFHELENKVREERHKQEIESEIATKDEVLRVQQEEYQKLITEHDELKRRFHELENKVREERHKQEIESDIATKDEVLRIQEEEHEKLITEYEELNRRFHALENEVREERHKQEIQRTLMEARCAAPTEELQQLRSRLGRLESQMGDKERENDVLRGELREMQKKCDDSLTQTVRREVECHGSSGIELERIVQKLSLEKEKGRIEMREASKELHKNTEASSGTHQPCLWTQANIKKEETLCSPVVKQRVQTPSDEEIRRTLAERTAQFGFVPCMPSSGLPACVPFGQSKDFQSLHYPSTGQRHPQFPVAYSPLSLTIGRASITPVTMHNARPGHARRMPYDKHPPKETDV
ncbi:golgin subfamily A member 6-like protein 1 isoform X2 [Ornithodoros turicata]|uniref:golgin subfamily A member 6-like protein 1 isoform X2 n=1 Tax=Ornithodoros turicata TaxID=34597 RepID=UPI003139FEF1